MNTITERVMKVLAERCDMPAERLTAETPLASLDLDSLTLLEVGLRLEQEFQVSVDEEAVAAAESVGDLVRAVESRLPAA